MDNFQARLREERERLGLSQAEMGKIGGVKKLAQFNYEKGDRRPDASYLTAIAAAGADVLYILTGQRSGAVDVEDQELTVREKTLLDNYRHCAAEDQAAIDRVALNAARPQQEALNPASGHKNTA